MSERKGNLHTMSSLANGRVVKFRIILTAGMVQEIQPRNNSGRTSGFRPGQYEYVVEGFIERLFVLSIVFAGHVWENEKI